MWLGPPHRQGHVGCHALSPLSCLNAPAAVPVSKKAASQKELGSPKVSSASIFSFDKDGIFSTRPSFKDKDAAGVGAPEPKPSMRARAYVDLFATAVQAYEKGDWADSQAILNNCLEVFEMN